MKSLVSRLTGGFHDASILIRPSQDYVILRGDNDTAPGQYLKGTVVLRLPTAQKVQGVQLSMVGHLRVAPHEPSLPAFGTSRTTTIFEHRWDPFDIHSIAQTDADGRAPAGNYEWPFRLLIPGATPETTKACARCSVAYYLKANTIRGKPGHPPQAFRCIRILRTLPAADYEMMDAATVEGTAADKMRYAVSIPHKAMALGTSIPVEVCVTLLGAGWRVKSVVGRLVEVHRLEGEAAQGHAFAGSREVLSCDLLRKHSPVEDTSGKHTHGHVRILEEILLPREAGHCSPDVDALGIRVSHILHVDVAVENGKGEAVRKHVVLPFTLFVSPAMPINGTGNFVRTPSPSPMGACAGVQVPPPYGCHYGDEMLEVPR